MKRIVHTSTLGIAMLSLALGGCSGSSSTAPDAQVSAAVRSSAHELAPDVSVDEAVQRFTAVMTQLRALPALAPLFAQYQVPDPMVFDDDARAAGLIELLQAVEITLVDGTLTIANRQTGAVIFTAPLSDLASGMLNPPGGTGASQCTYAYSDWSACQPNGMQLRAVISVTPAGCVGMPVLAQPCAGTPPPATTCTSFTYSAWGACQPDGTQTRAVVSASPASCTGGAPVTAQACVYGGAPLDGPALYTQSCSRCHGALATSNLKGKNISVSLIKSRGMTQGLSDAQLQAIVDAVGP